MPFDPNLYNEKYRIPSFRAEWWQYGGGCYHVVINTKFNQHYFGCIIHNANTCQNEMIFSKLGEFVNESIPKISEHQWYASVPVWAVMPNHIHLLILIDARGRIMDIDDNPDDNNTVSHDSSHAATGGVNDINTLSPPGRDVPWNVSTKYHTDNTKYHTDDTNYIMDNHTVISVKLTKSINPISSTKLPIPPAIPQMNIVRRN